MRFDIVDVETPSVFVVRTNVIDSSIGYKSAFTILLAVMLRITEGEMIAWYWVCVSRRG